MSSSAGLVPLYVIHHSVIISPPHLIDDQKNKMAANPDYHSKEKKIEISPNPPENHPPLLVEDKLTGNAGQVIHPELIELPEGHPPVTAEQLRTGLEDPKKPEESSSKESQKLEIPSGGGGNDEKVRNPLDEPKAMANRQRRGLLFTDQHLEFPPPNEPEVLNPFLYEDLVLRRDFDDSIDDTILDSYQK